MWLQWTVVDTVGHTEWWIVDAMDSETVFWVVASTQHTGKGTIYSLGHENWWSVVLVTHAKLQQNQYKCQFRRLGAVDPVIPEYTKASCIPRPIARCHMSRTTPNARDIKSSVSWKTDKWLSSFSFLLPFPFSLLSRHLCLRKPRPSLILFRITHSLFAADLFIWTASPVPPSPCLPSRVPERAKSKKKKKKKKKEKLLYPVWMRLLICCPSSKWKIFSSLRSRVLPVVPIKWQ